MCIVLFVSYIVHDMFLAFHRHCSFPCFSQTPQKIVDRIYSMSSTFLPIVKGKGKERTQRRNAEVLVGCSPHIMRSKRVIGRDHRCVFCRLSSARCAHAWHKARFVDKERSNANCDKSEKCWTLATQVYRLVPIIGWPLLFIHKVPCQPGFCWQKGAQVLGLCLHWLVTGGCIGRAPSRPFLVPSSRELPPSASPMVSVAWWPIQELVLFSLVSLRPMCLLLFFSHDGTHEEPCQ